LLDGYSFPCLTTHVGRRSGTPPDNVGAGGGEFPGGLVAPTLILLFSDPELTRDHCSGSCDVITALSDISTTGFEGFSKMVDVLNFGLLGVIDDKGSPLLPSSIVVLTRFDPTAPSF
jgi:hypothetical protein